MLFAQNERVWWIGCLDGQDLEAPILENWWLSLEKGFLNGPLWMCASWATSGKRIQGSGRTGRFVTGTQSVSYSSLTCSLSWVSSPHVYSRHRSRGECRKCARFYSSPLIKARLSLSTLRTQPAHNTEQPRTPSMAPLAMYYWMITWWQAGCTRATLLHSEGERQHLAIIGMGIKSSCGFPLTSWSLLLSLASRDLRKAIVSPLVTKPALYRKLSAAGAGAHGIHWSFWFPHLSEAVVLIVQWDGLWRFSSSVS